MYLLFVLSIIISCERGEGVLIITSESEARAYYSDREGKIDFNQPAVPNYGGLKSASQTVSATDPRLYNFLKSDFGKLKKVEHLLQKSLNEPIGKRFIDQLFDIAKQGAAEDKIEAVRLLKVINERQGGV